MFQLRIEGIVGAKILLDTHWPTRAVSLLAPKVRDWSPRGDHHLIQYFEDITEVRGDYIPPSIEFIQEALDFTKDLGPTDKLLVNCHMGCRRSPAMAIGIMIQHGMSPVEAYAHVKAVRPVAKPNMFMIGMIDEHFGLGGALTKAIPQ